ncbi:MAG TPA: sulfite exporter TauE/SafE family protein, partial [Actinomycetota bacterium]|nr:sulfite exporter TauE/SafE family protein [Actinomycetota bacterium]
MHIDPYVALAGLLVGFTVGLTGMGGGALMTPILVLLFKIQPLTAVSSDLVAAMVMKPVGGGVHARRGTVNWEIVKWLCIGSVPSAFAGVLILRSLGSGSVIQSRLKVILGA